MRPSYAAWDPQDLPSAVLPDRDRIDRRARCLGNMDEDDTIGRLRGDGMISRHDDVHTVRIAATSECVLSSDS